MAHPKQSNKLENLLQTHPDPAIYPLTLLEGDALKKITIMDREVLPLSGTLKNISDKPVKIVSIRGNCSCLKLDTYNDILLSPGNTLKLNFTLDAKILQKDDDNDFERKIIVRTEDFPPTFASVMGTVKNMFSFEPAQVIDLGEFIGDVSSWKRSIHIKSVFPQEKLALKAPENNRFFNLAITQSSPQDFLLEITPKSPFPINVIKEILEIGVEGIPNYGPLQVVVLGKPQGVHFVLLMKNKSVKREKIQDDTLEFDVPITLRSFQSNVHDRRSFRRQNKPTIPIANLPVRDDEEKVRPLDKPESWLAFIKDISTQTLPAGVKITLLPDTDGIKAHFMLEPQFLKNESAEFRAIFQYKNKPFGFFYFEVK
ncbi:MAG: hypothetical protein IKP00_12265 [Victivallales bacterium]|nr:hypothetical protein [Victivallales bacterium]